MCALPCVVKNTQITRIQKNIYLNESKPPNIGEPIKNARPIADPRITPTITYRMFTENVFTTIIKTVGRPVLLPALEYFPTVYMSSTITTLPRVIGLVWIGLVGVSLVEGWK